MASAPARLFHAVHKGPRGDVRLLSSRAAGAACVANPVALIVPCHRVLATGGIGDFGGGPTPTHALLEREGFGRG